MNKCYFCQSGTEPNFKDFEALNKYISPRKKILNREKTGLCAKHQRKLTKNIKYARYLALIPYVSYQNMR